MSELLFTGSGDAAADEAIRSRARQYSSMSEAKRRTDRSLQPVRKLVERVYTTNLRDPAETIMARNGWEILGRLFSGTVISARSASAAKLLSAPGETLPVFAFLTGNYRRNLSLPGIEVRMAEGPGALPGDLPFMGLHLASPARHCLENLQPSRVRGSGIARTTGAEEVERYLAKRCVVNGEESLNELRDQARDLKHDLGATAQFNELNSMISSLLRSQPSRHLRTREGRATVSGEPFDQGCVDRLNALFSFLSSTPMPRRADRSVGTAAAVNTAFIEAYFSNYIEGTTFEIGEAEGMCFHGVIPSGRSKDGHDVLSTFRQLADVEGLREQPRSFEDFVAKLKARHSDLMQARPEVGPGTFKAAVNRAGNTVFVHPDAVVGTLRRGFEMLGGLSEPFARAAFVHFLVSDVHPFSDGNGRLSRILMSGQLAAGGLSRAVIPTVFRDDYIGGQRAMSRFMDAAANFRALDRAQRVTSMIVEADRDACIRKWASTHAFVEPGAHAVMTDPDPAVELEWQDGIPAPAAYWVSMRNAHSPFR